MPTQEVNLGPEPFFDREYFGEQIQLESFLVVGGVGSIARLDIFQSAIQLETAMPGSFSFNPGPRFVEELEMNPSAFVFSEVGGNSITIPGPNTVSNSVRDDTEPYRWIPSASIVNAFSDWIDNLGDGDVILLLSTEIINRDVSISFRAGDPSFIVSGESVPLVNHDVSGIEFRAGNPSFTVAPVAVPTVYADGSVVYRAGNPLFRVTADLSPTIFRDASVTFRAGNPIVKITAGRELSDVGTLFSGQYVTQMEIAIDRVESERLVALIPPLLTDIDNVDVSLLPFIAYGLGIEGNINFLPLGVRCAIINNAEFYLNNIGTQLVLDQAAQDLEIALHPTFTDRQGGGRDVVLDVSPPTYAIGDANWTLFVRAFLESLLPWNVNLTGININVFFRESLYLHGGYRGYDLVFNDGGTAINSGVLP